MLNIVWDGQNYLFYVSWLKLCKYLWFDEQSHCIIKNSGNCSNSKKNWGIFWPMLQRLGLALRQWEITRGF